MLEDHTKWQHSRAYASRTRSALSGPERMVDQLMACKEAPLAGKTRYMSELGDNILLHFFFLQILKADFSFTVVAVLYLLTLLLQNGANETVGQLLQ